MRLEMDLTGKIIVSLKIKLPQKNPEEKFQLNSVKTIDRVLGQKASAQNVAALQIT